MRNRLPDVKSGARAGRCAGLRAMAPKSGPKPTTLSACLARAGFPQQLGAGEAERTIAEVRRIAKSAKAQVLSEEQLLSQLLRPVANLLLEFVPNFSSAPASNRLRFWRDAASVALGRTKAGAAYKQWLQTDATLTAAEHDLLTETLELPPNRKRPLQGDAKGEPEPAAKRLCGSSSGPSASDPEALRRKQEMAETVRNCQEDLEALRATQAKDLELFLEREERSMANRRARFHQTQADQVDQMQRQNMQIVADLRAPALEGALFPMFVDQLSRGATLAWLLYTEHGRFHGHFAGLLQVQLLHALSLRCQRIVVLQQEQSQPLDKDGLRLCAQLPCGCSSQCFGGDRLAAAWGRQGLGLY